MHYCLRFSAASRFHRVACACRPAIDAHHCASLRLEIRAFVSPPPILMRPRDDCRAISIRYASAGHVKLHADAAQRTADTLMKYSRAAFARPSYFAAISFPLPRAPRFLVMAYARRATICSSSADIRLPAPLMTRRLGALGHTITFDMRAFSSRSATPAHRARDIIMYTLRAMP